MKKNKTIKAATYYTSCSTLPLDRFIKVLVDGQLTSLTIEGNPTLADLSEAWGNIFLEYLDLNKHNQDKYRVELNRELVLLQQKLLLMDKMISTLTILYTPELGQRLDILFGYEFELDPANDEAYVRKLQLARSRSKEVSLNIRLKIIEIEALEEQKTDVKKVDAHYFKVVLAKIANHNHIAINQIRPENITVEEYCLMFNEYFDEVEAINKASQKKHA